MNWDKNAVCSHPNMIAGIMTKMLKNSLIIYQHSVLGQNTNESLFYHTKHEKDLNKDVANTRATWWNAVISSDGEADIVRNRYSNIEGGQKDEPVPACLKSAIVQ